MASKMCLKIRIGLTLLAIVLVILASVFSLYLIPKIVKDRINETVKLINGSDAYERWEKLPIPIQYKIYFFNVSNPSQVQRGAKPRVREIGPYIYNQRRWKDGIVESSDTLSYDQYQLFEFDFHASYPLTDTDDINIVNLPLMAVITMAEKHVFPLLSMLNEAIDEIFSNPKDLFLRTTPKNFLFDGIFLACNNNDTLINVACQIIEKLAPPTLIRIEDGTLKFSLLSHKNNTDEGHFVVNSGRQSIEKLGQISSWKGSPILDTWLPNSSCNEIFGTDSTVYSPSLNPESKINVFSVDICRSITLEYAKDTEYRNIFGHRFTAGKKMLSSPSSLNSNKCYCLNMTQGINGPDGCLLDGVMELWTCQGAPVVLSLPHFYLAAREYQEGVEGVKSNSELHEMYVDLEPNTGTPLRGHKKAQFNIFYRPIEKITLTNDLTTTLVPIVWIDEGVELSDDLLDLLNEELFDVLDTLNAINWSIFGLGIVILIINLLWYAVVWRQKSKVN